MRKIRAFLSILTAIIAAVSAIVVVFEKIGAFRGKKPDMSDGWAVDKLMSLDGRQFATLMDDD